MRLLLFLINQYGEAVRAQMDAALLADGAAADGPGCDAAILRRDDAAPLPVRLEVGDYDRHAPVRRNESQCKKMGVNGGNGLKTRRQK